MAQDERWDGKFISSFHVHADLFIVQFHHITPCCKDLRQVAKFCDRVNPKKKLNFCALELAHQTTTSIIPLTAFLSQ